jgi:hypothetical protein
MVSSAERLRWCSPWHRINDNRDVSLSDRPLTPGEKWLDYVNQVETKGELKALRQSVQTGIPFGQMVCQQATAKRLGLESTSRRP